MKHFDLKLYQLRILMENSISPISPAMYSNSLLLEEEIDAVMAMEAGGSFVSGSFDATELPPTETMSRPSPAPPSDKVMERCKFWPACRQGDSCTYVHPTKHCLYVLLLFYFY